MCLTAVRYSVKHRCVCESVYIVKELQKGAVCGIVAGCVLCTVGL